jgi:glutamate-1-semialdehyde 2,1-aminomutase
MERIAPAGDVYQAGTLSGNPVAVAAGLATLDLLDADAYAQLEQTTTKLADGIAAVAADAGVAVQVPRLPGLFTVFFSPEPVRDYEGAKGAYASTYAAFCRALLERGVYPPASQFEAWFPSLAHDDAHIDRTLDAVQAAFREL